MACLSEDDDDDGLIADQDCLRQALLYLCRELSAAGQMRAAQLVLEASEQLSRRH